MPEENPFQQLIQRVRAGDQEAAAELLRRYEPTIRRTVHIHLRDARLRRLLDSMDICQSVFASFFVRAASGQYQLETPEHLLKLLAVMARNKLAGQARKKQVQQRDPIRGGTAGALDSGLAASDPSPSREVAARDLLQEFQRRLTPEERQLADQRAQGREWAEIAADLGGSPQALRKRLERALDRVARQLGLDEADDF